MDAFLSKGKRTTKLNDTMRNVYPYFITYFFGPRGESGTLSPRPEDNPKDLPLVLQPRRKTSATIAVLFSLSLLYAGVVLEDWWIALSGFLIAIYSFSAYIN